MPHPDRSPTWSPRTHRLAAALLALGTALVYARVGRFPFIAFDDNRYITENDLVQRGLTWEGIAWAFTTFQVSNWHPLTWLSHMFDVQLFGLEPGAHHLVNVGLHAVSAALLFLALARMTRAPGRSLFVAALFALHPLHVESVAWVAERKDVLSTFFGVSMLLAYARHAERPGRGRYLPVALLFASSLLAKPMWVTAPFLLLLLDLWPLQRLEGLSLDGRGPALPRRSWRQLLVEKAPLLALSIGSCAVTVLAQRRGGALNGLGLGLGPRLGNVAVAYLRYLAKTFWPTDLAIYYPYAMNALPAWQTVLAAALLMALSGAILFQARRLPWLAVGWCWFLGTLVPVIGLVQVGGQGMADRYTYLPIVGLFIAVAWEGERLLAGRLGGVPLRALALALPLLCAVLTVHQLGYWSDHEKLFRHALAVTPANAIARGILSQGLRGQGRLSEALIEARAAVEISPNNPRHWDNLSVSLRDLGHWQEAREASLRAVELDPGDGMGWFSLGKVELDLGHLSESMAALERSAQLRPDQAAAWNILAILYDRVGQVAEAGAAFERVTRLTTRDPEAWRNLGVFQAKHGRPEEAALAFERALSLAPGNTDLLRRLEQARAAR